MNSYQCGESEPIKAPYWIVDKMTGVYRNTIIEIFKPNGGRYRYRLLNRTDWVTVKGTLEHCQELAIAAVDVLEIAEVGE